MGLVGLSQRTRLAILGLGDDDAIAFGRSFSPLGEATGARGLADATSRNEESGIFDGDAALRSAIGSLSRMYEHTHGFRFVIAADGRSSANILSEIAARLENSRTSELLALREQMSAIIGQRMQRLIREIAAPAIAVEGRVQ